MYRPEKPIALKAKLAINGWQSCVIFATFVDKFADFARLCLPHLTTFGNFTDFTVVVVKN